MFMGHVFRLIIPRVGRVFLSSCLDRFTILFCIAGIVPLGWGAESISFNQDIRPILSENCFLCHGPDEEDRAAGLRLDEPGGAYADRDGVKAIVPGDPEGSELIRRIETSDLDDLMPPPDSERELSAEEKVLLRKWIAGGAAYEEHWSYKPIVKSEVPEIPGDDLCWNPIDRFIRHKLLARGLDFSPLATTEKRVRRASFDLTGLPPTLERLESFEHDQSPGKWGRLVDELLQSEAYGERMASEWLDVARYSDTYGYQVDRDRFVWPWRDWVIDAFNQNLAYDEFVTWQLAGDLLPNPTREQVLATTFNRLHPQKVEGGSVPEEFRIEYVADRTQTFATAFMGVTFECARCHDHKYDPFKQREYYQLSSFFANIDEAGLYSYFTDSIPTPTMVIGPEDKERELEQKRKDLQSVLDRSPSVGEQAAKRFEAWLGDQGDRTLEAKNGVAWFDFESMEEGKLVNHWGEKASATTPNANTLVAGASGSGLRLSGDDEVDLKVGNFSRFEPFSFSLWLSIPKSFERSVVFHRSRAWTDAGSRGYQFLLEDGKPSFSLIHFWPGNAIRVRGADPLPLNEFVHVGITYDGSISAEGVSIYINGQRAETEIVRDYLTKNITGGGHDHIAIGARFRDIGFKQGVVDEFKVFDFELSELEIRELYQPGALSEFAAKRGESLSAREREQLEEYYRLRVDEEVGELAKELQVARSKVAGLEDGLKEIMVMKEAPMPRTSYVLNRGAYDDRRDPVENLTPASLPEFKEAWPRNRLGLATWLTDPSHPLVARVTVNRYWQMIFGQGLVRTSEDFGSQGQPPTHPELLDWLAADFIEHGWDVKRLLKQLVTSRTYQQVSSVTREELRIDPENRLLSRGPRYRLSAEMIRDNALAVSGLLVSRIGGPPVKPYEVAVSFKPAKVDQGDGVYRRSLYTYWKRTGPAPVMMALDASKRDVCTVKRETTATPLQAFVFMNDPQFVEAARHLALRVLHEVAGSVNQDHLNLLFRFLTSRDARAAELEILEQLFEDQRIEFGKHPEQVKAFLGVGQSPLSEEQATAELAALTVVASGLFSHDECLMKR